MIVDCFPFFDELDLLEIRLHELQDVVDVFVLTESPYTFTGIEKPLYFQDNKERFKEFNIVHTVYTPGDEYTPMEHEEFHRPMHYEVCQKQYSLDHALTYMSKGDILIQGDVDEIPKAAVLKEVVKDRWKIARLEMTLYYYYMNCVGTLGRLKSGKTKKQRNSLLIKTNGSRINYKAHQQDKVNKVYYDAGWHFSYLGDIAQIQAKIAAWGHAPKYNKPPFNTTENIEKCMEQGLDMFHRTGPMRPNFEFIKDDLSYLPQYVLENMGKFEQYIKR